MCRGKKDAAAAPTGKGGGKTLQQQGLSTSHLKTTLRLNREVADVRFKPPKMAQDETVMDASFSYFALEDHWKLVLLSM